MSWRNPDAITEDFLLRVAVDSELRDRVYEHLREYCHQCRNRLNSLKLSIYLAMKQATGTPVDRWVEVDRHYQELERRVEHVQFLCRPLRLSRVTLGLDLLIDDRGEEWKSRMADRGMLLKLVPPVERALASFDVERLATALDALVAWRAADSQPARSAKLRWWVEAGRAHLTWEEDRGQAKLVNQDEVHPDAFWPLAVLARVVEAHGGACQIQADRFWRLEVVWPSQPSTHRA